MKIYFLINSLEGGGAERVTINLAGYLSREHDVTIITLKDVNFYELPEHVKYLPLSSVKSNLLMFLLIPYYALKFKKILDTKGFDTGISSLEIANFVNLLVNKNANIAFEISITFFKGFSGFVYKKLIKLLYPRARKIKVNSQENRYDLAEFLGKGIEKIDVIYNPIDRHKIETLRTEKLSDKLVQKIYGKKVFVTVGRLIWQKYHSKLIDSFKKVHEKFGDDWIYLIVGGGEEHDRLEKQILTYGLQDRILMVGAQKNVFQYLEVADYFVYASKIEGFPNVLCEAMACGLPIITSSFKTGARECIFGTYDSQDRKTLDFPQYGPNGALLRLEDYESDFLEVFGNLGKLKQTGKGIENFQIENVCSELIKCIK